MDRREFLAWSAVAAGSLMTNSVTAAGMQRAWQFAAEPGLFECDVLPTISDELRFAAEHGFTAMVDASWLSRSLEERVALQQLARKLNVVWGPFRGPRYSCVAADRWAEHFEAAMTATRQLGVPSLRIEFPTATWCACGTTASAEAAAIHAACEQSITLLVEPLARSSVDYESALRQRAEDAMFAGRLAVDVYQLAASGVDVVSWLDRYLPRIGHLELADFPGGLEPGTGSLDLAGIVAVLDRYQYDGLVGLRHGRSTPGTMGVAAVLHSVADWV